MRSFPLRPALFALCLIGSSIRLAAQTFKLPPITFTGAPSLSQSDLFKVSGLQPGATSTQAEVQSAAQRLSDTGLFTDVHFESTPQGLIYSLKLMPAENLLPASFTNFPWWSSEELNTTMKARIPLYSGLVPLSGNIQDSILATLKALVAEKGVNANIVAIPLSAQTGATPTAIAFAIDTPEVRVHTLTFTHASPSMQTKLDKVSKYEVGKSFEHADTRATIVTQVTQIYRNDGYLDIAITGLTHAAPQVTPTSIDLDLTVDLDEGEPYRLSQLTWSGSDIMSTADFNKQVKLKPEDIASDAVLRQSLRVLASAYFAKGFQDAKIQAPATIDPTTHHVAYTVRVVPGDQYRLKSVRTNGLSEVQQKEFNSAWRMKPGDIYDATYVTSFLTKNSALQSLAEYSATYKAYSDPNTHLVDLVLTFIKGGTLVD
jgi:outer membrane protein assembly factor BamA